MPALLGKWFGELRIQTTFIDAMRCHAMPSRASVCPEDKDNKGSFSRSLDSIGQVYNGRILGQAVGARGSMVHRGLTDGGVGCYQV